MNPSIEHLALVARRLGELRKDVVFLGGCIVPLHVPAVVAPTLRPTDDVDCVVKATSYPDYHRVGERLKGQGFSECTDPRAPICRWTVQGIRVDVMPTSEEALGFKNRWFDRVLASPISIQLEPDLQVNVASVPTFLATKFDAFEDRGQGAYYGDADLEDIITVIAYRSDAVDLITRSEVSIIEYLAERARELRALQNLKDIVSGCLPTDDMSQAGVVRVLRALAQLAELQVNQ